MTTRVIPTKVHAIVDAVTGPTLVAAPNVGGFDDSAGSALSARAVGGGATVLSAMTDYELGLVRLVPMRVHLTLDALNGALLAAMPPGLDHLVRRHDHVDAEVVVGLGQLVVQHLQRMDRGDDRRPLVHEPLF